MGEIKMKYIQPLNIIHKNGINEIGNSLISARRAIENENHQLQLSPQQILRLVLLGCLSIEIQQSSGANYSFDFEEGQTFTALRNYIKTQIDDNWIQEYLYLSEFEMSSIKYDSAFQFLKSNLGSSLFSHLLPYALELLEYSEQDLAKASTDRRFGIVTHKKKTNGIYYTPADVASYMTETCVNELSKKHNSLFCCRFMDFSCGSGIFLLQIIDSVFQRLKINSFEDYVSYISSSLFGMDISKYAVDCARYTVLSHSIRKFQNQKVNIKSLLKVLEQNIVSADATKLLEYFECHPDYPQRFDCIIGNPPYVGVITESKNGAQQSSRSNLFIPFVSNLVDYSTDNSICALVIPLSFSYNNQPSYRDMRRMIQKDSAEWYIEHYDRSPDSLFGDDVKSRNCIIFRNQGNTNHKIYVTGLIRWTSINRSQLWSTTKYMTDITDLTIEDYIPKLGTLIEKQAFSAITTNGDSLLQQLVSKSLEKIFLVVIKGTAYNWICAYDHIPAGKDKNGNEYVSKDLKVYSAQTEDDAYFVLAVLNSTFAFWLWTVIGDGFHVTNRLLSSLCISKISFSKHQYSKMVSLGKEFSSKIIQYPSQSVNNGKIITNYDHLPLHSIISQIDFMITEALKLPADFPKYLHDWYANIVSCGR